MGQSEAERTEFYDLLQHDLHEKFGASTSRTNEVTDFAEQDLLPALDMIAYAAIDTALRGLDVPPPVAAAIAGGLVQLADSLGNNKDLADTLWDVGVAVGENALASAAVGKFEKIARAGVLAKTLQALPPAMQVAYRVGDKTVVEMVDRGVDKATQTFARTVVNNVVDQTTRLPVRLTEKIIENTTVGPSGEVNIDPKWKQRAVREFGQAAVNVAVGQVMHLASKGLPLEQIKTKLVTPQQASSKPGGVEPHEHAPAGVDDQVTKVWHRPANLAAAPPAHGYATKSTEHMPSKPVAGAAPPTALKIPKSLPKAPRTIGVDRNAIPGKIEVQFRAEAKKLEAQAGNIPSAEWDKRHNELDGQIQKTRDAAAELERRANQGGADAANLEDMAKKMRDAASAGETALAEAKGKALVEAARKENRTHAVQYGQAVLGVKEAERVLKKARENGASRATIDELERDQRAAKNECDRVGKVYDKANDTYQLLSGDQSARTLAVATKNAEDRVAHARLDEKQALARLDGARRSGASADSISELRSELVARGEEVDKLDLASQSSRRL